jgi:hypothetical protein
MRDLANQVATVPQFVFHRPVLGIAEVEHRGPIPGREGRDLLCRRSAAPVVPVGPRNKRHQEQETPRA